MAPIVPVYPASLRLAFGWHSCVVQALPTRFSQKIDPAVYESLPRVSKSL